MINYTELVKDYVFPTGISVLNHPVLYARTMMMLGYEPDPPQLRPILFTLIKNDYRRYMYPTVFTYLRRLREEIGLFNLFTIGLPANILGDYLRSFSTEKLMEKMTGKRFKKPFYVTEGNFDVFLTGTSQYTLARVFGVTVSYPLQVIMIRQMAALVGGDGTCSSILFAIPQMIRDEGILSLFNGLIPRVLGEIFTLWMISCFAYLLNQYVLSEHMYPSMKQHTPMIASIFVPNTTHPLKVTSTVMAISGSKLTLALTFTNWWQCYRFLSSQGALGRGSSLFFRYAPEVKRY